MGLNLREGNMRKNGKTALGVNWDTDKARDAELYKGLRRHFTLTRRDLWVIAMELCKIVLYGGYGVVIYKIASGQF